MSTSGLKTIKSAPLHEQVYQEILRALMSGQFEPGQKLTSRALAKDLGVSDMPVRSALVRLQSLRALSPLPNGVMEVTLLGRDQFAQLMETRVLLECSATKQAIPNINGNVLRTIRHNAKLLTEAAQKKDISQYLLMNYQFKFSIYRHCHNEMLCFLIETLWLQGGPFLRNFASSFKGNLSGILEIDYHEEMVMAIEARDTEGAASALERDIAEGANFLLKHAKFHDD